MFNIERLLKENIYISSIKFKNEILINYLKSLTIHHFNKCPEYRKIIKSQNIKLSNIDNLSKIPFLPADLFKKYLLKSIPKNKIYKILNSSGTSNQQTSKIFLDKTTSNFQTKVLIKIINSLIGLPRIPMIIIDSNKIFNKSDSYSARIAGILGFSIFASEKIFLLNDDMNIDFKKLEIFIKKNKDKTILLFGFTSIIWEHFYKIIQKSKKKINLSNGILIHGGGWKKLNEINITNEEFKKKLFKTFKLKKVYNYYGMVEQTGSIYIECEKGYLHPSLFSDILVRDKFTLKILPQKEIGIIQTFSILPTSYPGHSILTEDVGVIEGLDGCQCKRVGKFFKVFGRLSKAEVRGCSDTF
jgi:phenylacetate-coenzyme A ligase PaaK-like adenylate-forming protein